MQKTKTPFATILIWGIVAVGLALLLSFAGAMLISKGMIPENMMGIISAVIALISVFTSVVFAINGQGKGARNQVAIGVSAIYLLLCIACKALFFRGGSDNIWLITGACVVAAVLAMMVTAMGQGRKRPNTHRRR